MEALFDQFWEFTTVTFGPLGPFYAIAALGAVLVIVAAPMALRKQVDPIKRLETLERRVSVEDEGRSLRVDEDRGKFKALSPYLEPSDEGELWAFPSPAELSPWSARVQDTDGDGIVDYVDECDFTEPGAGVDDRGCATE